MGLGAKSGAVREVVWPEDPAQIAESLSRHAHWCWLDGETPDPLGAPSRSYFGVAAEVRHAVVGDEAGFLAGLRASPGDWVMSFGYEFGVGLLGLTPSHDTEAPALAMRLSVTLVLDHEQRRATLHGPTTTALDEWWEEHGDSFASCHTTARARKLTPSPIGTPLQAGEPVAREAPTRSVATAAPVAPVTRAEHEAVWRHTPSVYLDRVEACRGDIRDGNAYVLCLTDTARVAGPVDPLDLYLRLRAHGPALRGGILVTGGRALVSASPERFLSVRGRTVRTHPIKGTRPRGAHPLEDDRLAADLAADRKERAENLMIVDLMRNDLSRVCEPGSVQVEHFLRVERHPHVHQLVSTVSGTLDGSHDVYAAFEAAFPGGSMTGAPKQRAVRILEALEAGPRGWYSGCFGWIDAAGNAELAMTIRSVELRGITGPAPYALVGAGGGITADSVAAEELAEQRHKAEPLLRALVAVAAADRREPAAAHLAETVGWGDANERAAR